MMHCSKRMRSVPESWITSSTLRTDEAPAAAYHLDLALLGEHRQAAGKFARPPGSSRRAACRRSSCGSPNTMPCSPIAAASSMTLAACSSALEGMQPTFRHTPPELLPAFDQRHLQPQVGGAECGGVAAGTRAEHQQLGGAGDGFAGTRVAAARRRSACAPYRRGLHRPAPVRLPRPPRRCVRAPAAVPVRGATAAASRRAISGALGDLVAALRQTSVILPAALAGTSIVALSVSSVTSGRVHFDLSPGLHQHLDDRHIAEIADVRDQQVDAHGTASISARGSASVLARKVVKRAAMAPSITR